MLLAVRLIGANVQVVAAEAGPARATGAAAASAKTTAAARAVNGLFMVSPRGGPPGVSGSGVEKSVRGGASRCPVTAIPSRAGHLSRAHEACMNPDAPHTVARDHM